METNTTIADDLLSAGEDVQYDAVCKRILSERWILAYILKTCVKEFKDIDVKEIATRYIQGEPTISQVTVHPNTANPTSSASKIRGSANADVSEVNAPITYDIRFYVTVPNQKKKTLMQIIINVEAQGDFYPGYTLVTRGVYYGSRMISSEYGEVFTGSAYQNIIPVYSIWICMNPPKKFRNTITRYHITEEPLVGEARQPAEKYDLMTVVMVHLGDSKDDHYEGLLKLLDVIFSGENTYEEKKQILGEEYSIPMSQKLEGEVSSMCNLSKGVENRGILKGKIESKIEDIQNLMKNTGWSLIKAMDLLNIPETDREIYLDMLHNQEAL